MKTIVHYIPNGEYACRYCGTTRAFIVESIGHAHSSSLPWVKVNIIDKVHPDYVMCNSEENHLEGELFEI